MREHLTYFRSFLEQQQVVTDKQGLLDFGSDSSPEIKGEAGLVLLPNCVPQVSKILAYCAQHQIALIPSGGRTGYSGGAAATKAEIVLSLNKLNKILEVDALGATLSCEAGACTEAVQNAAARAGLYFPIDFASKGSSQIGGNLATNAGGIRVVRYGSTRDWLLGMKIVLASGEVLDLNGALIKNRSGYDLQQLIIGSEGTLAVIVEASFKLAAQPKASSLAFCAIDELSSALITLRNLQSQGFTVNVFEFLDLLSLTKVLEHNSSCKDPFITSYPYYLVIEVESDSHFEQALLALIENGTLKEVVLGCNSTQVKELMSLRERISESITKRYSAHKNDLSVPLKNLAAYVKELKALLGTVYPNFQAAIFGHIGDGNIHLNILKPEALSSPEFLATVHAGDQKVFALTRSMGGSVSAEHGIGLAKKAALSFVRTQSEIQLMQQIKKVFDPQNILNPGKIW